MNLQLGVRYFPTHTVQYNARGIILTSQWSESHDVNTVLMIYTNRNMGIFFIYLSKIFIRMKFLRSFRDSFNCSVMEWFMVFSFNWYSYLIVRKNEWSYCFFFNEDQHHQVNTQWRELMSHFFYYVEFWAIQY